MHDGSSARPFPWLASSATGIGSMPGTDPAQAIAVVLGELPDLPHLPELPARGAGADLIGRTAALLIEMPAETTARGWRLADRPGRDIGRATGLMSQDLDVAEEAAAGYAGPFKIAVCGPWTLAAALELTKSMEPALADAGAVRDLVASLAEGVAAHVGAVRRRLSAATIILQLDEPGLPGVLAGSVPSASGLNRIAPVEESVAAGALRAVLAAAQAPTVVHCCASAVPFGCITSAAPTAVAFDLSLLRRDQEDAVGETVESGLGLLAGAVSPLAQGGAQPAGNRAGPPGNGDGGRSQRRAGQADQGNAAHETARSVIALWLRIGLPVGQLAERVVVTPSCGLAGASPDRARAVLTQCREAGRLIPELIEEGVS